MSARSQALAMRGAQARDSVGVLLYAIINNVELASMHILDRNRGEIDIKKTTDIYTPFVWSGSRPTKGQDSADGAEIVLRCLCVPLVQGKPLDRG